RQLEARIDRLALKGEHGEDALVNPAKWLAGDEPLQCLVTEGEFAEREVALAAEATFAQADEMLGQIVFRAVNDPEIFAATHLEGRLNEVLWSAKNKFARLHHHPFPAALCEFLPPGRGAGASGRVRQVNPAPACRRDHRLAGSGKFTRPVHMPEVVAIEPDVAFARQEMERGDPEIVDADDRPDIRRPGARVAIDTAAPLLESH